MADIIPYGQNRSTGLWQPLKSGDRIVDANGDAITGTGLRITTTTLPDAVQLSPYSQTLARTGGSSPFTWSITVGSLPAGLSLNASTGAITGTPTSFGTSNFTARITDSEDNFDGQALSIVVIPANINTSALDFSWASTAYVKSTNQINLGVNDPFTLELWLKLTATFNALGFALLIRDAVGGSRTGFQVRSDRTLSYGEDTAIISTSAIPDTTGWHNVVCRRTAGPSSNIVWRIDEVAAGSSTSPAVNNGVTNGHAWINQNGIAGQFLNSQVDEARFWNVYRSDTDLDNNNNLEISPSTSGLIYYYRMNDNQAMNDTTSGFAITEEVNNTSKAFNFDPTNRYITSGLPF